MISQAAFQVATHQEHSETFLLGMAAISDLSLDPAKHPDYQANLVPMHYEEFLPLFTKKEADKLPPHRYVDHEISVEADKKPPIGQMYSMSASELLEIRK